MKIGGQPMRCVGLVAVMFFAACEGGPASEGALEEPHTVQDSAGVVVVTQHQEFEQAIARWTVDPESVVEIGEAEGAEHYLFTQLFSAVRLSDGRVVMAEGLTREIRDTPTWRFSDGEGVQERNGKGA